MTNYTPNLLIKPILLSKNQFSNIKNSIAHTDWGILLESADTEHIDSRWSIYSAQPIATLQTQYGKTQISEGENHSESQEDPFTILEKLRNKLFHHSELNSELPFTGGALGHMAYELGYQIERINNDEKPCKLDLPEMAFGFYNWALLYDNKNAIFHLLIHKDKKSKQDLQTLWEKRYTWLKKQSENIITTMDFQLDSEWSSNMSKQDYQAKFKQIQNYILSGDCYEVNLAQRFQATYQGDEYQAYQKLFADNLPPFAAFLRLPTQRILSLSPERFLKLNNGTVESKPIKGTRPRYKDLKKDQQSRLSLLNSPKDRAENLMIVDLLRNDIGRVCRPGSVNVPKLFDVESFPAVHHLVSTVSGQLDKNCSCEKLLRACFPGGSITGAPKIRAMDIIAELEPHGRQLYCGSIGYINGNGDMDMNIGIRSLVCYKQRIYCWAGGALVADSNVDEEYQECFDKVSKILPSLSEL